MGANNTTGKHQQNLYDTPPKRAHRLLYDPRSPNDAIARTPIQIDAQVPSKVYNQISSPIVGPDLPRKNETKENQAPHPTANIPTETDGKRTSGVEPTLDPTTVLTALVANNDGKLPPYQL